MLVQIHGMLAQPKETREWYTVEEVAAMLGKTTYTVREWCRLGRINATKRSERRGGAELWSISAAEIARYKDEGLLPPIPIETSSVDQRAAGGPGDGCRRPSPGPSELHSTARKGLQCMCLLAWEQMTIAPSPFRRCDGRESR